MYYKSYDMTGKGSKVAICKDDVEQEEQFYILKESFLLSLGPNGVKNHALYIMYLWQCARHLSANEERIFSEMGKFDKDYGNKMTFGTQKSGNKIHLYGIPVLVTTMVVSIPYYGLTAEQDSTETIIHMFMNSQNLRFE